MFTLFSSSLPELLRYTSLWCLHRCFEKTWPCMASLTDGSWQKQGGLSTTGSGLCQLGQRHRTARRCREEKRAFLGDRASARTTQNRGQVLAQEGLHHWASRTTVGPQASTFSLSLARKRRPCGYSGAGETEAGSPCVHCHLQNVHLKVPLCVTPSEVSLFYRPLSTGHLSTLQGTIFQGTPSVSEHMCSWLQLPACFILMAPESGL